MIYVVVESSRVWRVKEFCLIVSEPRNINNGVDKPIKEERNVEWGKPADSLLPM